MFGNLKTKPNESNPEILVKKNKNPIWNFFKNNETDKSKAVCALCFMLIEADTEKPCSKQMAILAKVYLTPPPTSADVERLFSSGSHVLNKFRNRLLPHNSEKLLFCHENMSRVNYQFY